MRFERRREPTRVFGLLCIEWSNVGYPVVILVLNSIAANHKMRTIRPVTEQTPMLRILTAIRVTRKSLKQHTFFKPDSESAICVASRTDDMQRRLAVPGEPLTLYYIKNGGILVPVEIAKRNLRICRAKQVVTPEQDSCLVHYSPSALHV